MAFLFPPTEAGLEGFRITRENRGAFARWVFFSFLISILGALVNVSMPPEVRSALDTLASDTTPDASTLVDALIQVAPLMIFGLMIQCMMAAAVYRIILRHDDARYGYLRLGIDEVRLMALTIVYLAIAIGLLVLVSMAAALVMAVSSVAGESAAVFMGAVAELFALGIVVYVGVRLSLAPVITFAERRLTIFESWRLTRGAFWPLFLAYALAFVCFAAIALLTLVLFAAVAGVILLVSGGQLSDLQAFFQPDETSFSAYFNPGMVAYMFVGSVVTSLYYAVIAAPGAWAYLRLHGVPPPPPLRRRTKNG